MQPWRWWARRRLSAGRRWCGGGDARTRGWRGRTMGFPHQLRGSGRTLLRCAQVSFRLFIVGSKRSCRQPWPVMDRLGHPREFAARSPPRRGVYACSGVLGRAPGGDLALLVRSHLLPSLGSSCRERRWSGRRRVSNKRQLRLERRLGMTMRTRHMQVGPAR
jgi:hypothetical protein